MVAQLYIESATGEFSIRRRPQSSSDWFIHYLVIGWENRSITAPITKNPEDIISVAVYVSLSLRWPLLPHPHRPSSHARAYIFFLFPIHLIFPGCLGSGRLFVSFPWNQNNLTWCISPQDNFRFFFFFLIIYIVPYFWFRLEKKQVLPRNSWGKSAVGPLRLPSASTGAKDANRNNSVSPQGIGSNLWHGKFRVKDCRQTRHFAPNRPLYDPARGIVELGRTQCRNRGERVRANETRALTFFSPLIAMKHFEKLKLNIGMQSPHLSSSSEKTASATPTYRNTVYGLVMVWNGAAFLILFSLFDCNFGAIIVVIFFSSSPKNKNYWTIAALGSRAQRRLRWERESSGREKCSLARHRLVAYAGWLFSGSKHPAPLFSVG